MAAAINYQDQLLQCNICLDRLKSPRALPCLHSFCETCLQQHVKISHNSKGRTNSQFMCPTCRTPTNITKQGVTGFPVDFRINQLNDVLETMSKKRNSKHFVCEICTYGDSANMAAKKYCTDCQKYFCNNCSMKHKMSVVLKSHSLVDVLSYDEEEILFCTTHKNEPIKFFCKPCDLEICLFCVLGDHENHMISSFEDVYVVKKDNLTACMNHIENQISFLNAHIFDITCKEGNIRIKYVEEKLAHSKRHKYRANRSSEKYMDLLDTTYKIQAQNYKEEKDHCYEYLSQFKMIRNKVEVIMRSGNVRVLLDVYSNILHEIQQIDVRTEIIRFDMHLNSSEKSKQHFQFLRLMEPRHYSDRSFYPIQSGDNQRQLNFRRGDNPRQLNFQRGENFTLVTDKTSMETGYNLKRLTTALNRMSRLSTAMLPRQLYNPSKYQTINQPKLKLVYKIGGFGHEPGLLNLPFGISFLTDNVLVVSENGNGRIQKFDSSGQSLECIQLRSGYPRCVTTGNNDEIFITDEHNKCIKKISKETETKINQSKDDIHFPYGIAALDDGNLVVSDMIYERMSIIKPTGEMTLQFGHYGNTNSTFDNPSYVATDGELILISDSGHHQVKVFDKSGKYMWKMGDYGSDNGELRYPKGLAVSPLGNIVVADSGNNRVVMFSKTGQFMTILLTMDDNIDRPIDIACSSSGLLGVAMPDIHEVFVYQLDQTFRQ